VEPGVFLLYGEPGVGKSTLALRFAWDAQKDFDAVIFQTCGQRPVDAITAELADRLPIDVKTRPPEEHRCGQGLCC
jgi:predicted ATP-dependent serine protease